MKSINCTIIAFFAFVMLSFNINCLAAFDDSQKKELEQIIHDYLVTNPEVLIEASKALQQKQQEEILKNAKEAIPEESDKLFQAKSPAVGDNKDTSVAMFFDYQCVHCKKMSAIIGRLIKENKNVRFVFKEFPIFGPDSEYASKAALASHEQDKYFEFHTALMEAKPPLNKQKVLEVASSVKIDTKLLEKTITNNKDKYDAEFKQNMELAQKLGIMGTPAFVIAGNISKGKNNMKSFFVPGASSYDTLKNLVKEALN